MMAISTSKPLSFIVAAILLTDMLISRRNRNILEGFILGVGFTLFFAGCLHLNIREIPTNHTSENRISLHQQFIQSINDISLPGCGAPELSWQCWFNISTLPVNFSIRKFETSYENVEFRTKHLCLGGRFQPSYCRAQFKVAIIVPYRNREEHLQGLLYHLHTLLPLQELEYQIYVIEQVDSNEVSNDTFNKASLLNVGYMVAQRHHSWDCYVFHDVDLYPVSDRTDYTCSARPRVLHTGVQNWDGGTLGYLNYFGGVVQLTQAHMELVNGFSNLYWGWGGEDDDMGARLAKEGLLVDKSFNNDSLFMNHRSVEQGKEQGNEWNSRNEQIQKHHSWTKSYKTDGLNSIQAKFVDVEPKAAYTLIRVDLLENRTRSRQSTLPNQERHVSGRSGRDLEIALLTEWALLNLSSNESTAAPSSSVHDLDPLLEELQSNDLLLDAACVEPLDAVLVGEGHFGAVCRVRHKTTQEIWAVKCVWPEKSEQEWAEAMLVQEAWAMLQVRGHAHIVEIRGVLIDYTNEDSLPSLAMEFMEGGSLSDYLNELEPCGLNDMLVQQLGDLIRQVASAVSHILNCGMVHRDLAVRNVLLDKSRTIAKLSDFGHCRLLNEQGDYIVTDHLLPLPVRSAAPELSSGVKRFTGSTEVYAFAVLVHEVFSLGKEPFKGLNNLEVMKLISTKTVQLSKPQGCPTPWMDLMTRCFSTDVRDRMTMAEVTREIESIQTTGAVTDRLRKPSVPLLRGRSGNRIQSTVLRGSFVALLVFLVPILISLLLTSDPQAPACSNVTFEDVLVISGGLEPSDSSLVVISAIDGTELHSQKNVLRPALSHHVSASLSNDEILYIGGVREVSNGSKAAVATSYILNTVTWETRATTEMHVSRCMHAAVQIDDYILVCGGVYGVVGHLSEGIPHNSCEQYQHAGSWNLINNMTQPRVGLSLSVVQMGDAKELIYAIGGKFVKGREGFALTVERMEYPDGKWETVGDLPEGNWLHASATLRTDIWVCGGRWEDYCRVLQTSSGKWGPVIYSVVGHSVGLTMFSHNQRLLLIGGAGEKRSMVSMFDAKSESWSRNSIRSMIQHSSISYKRSMCVCT